MTSTASSTAFFVGLGFIGGTVFARLREARPDIQIKAMVRREEHIPKLLDLGVEPVRGTLDDTEIIKSVVADPKVNIVFHVATADHVPSAQAIAEGLRARPKDAPTAVYIHTSGAAELVDGSHGDVTVSEDYTFHDATAAGLDDRLKPDAPHRDVDLKLRELIANPEAEKQYNVRVGLILPGLIYGLGSGPFHRHSIQIPTYIQTALDVGHGVYLGGGKGVWNAIHVQDLATAYLTVLKHLESTAPGSDDSPYYVAGTQVYQWMELVKTIAGKLHSLGQISSAQVSSLQEEEYSKFPIPVPSQAAWANFADNSLADCEHLRAIGWVPDKSLPSVFESIEQTEVGDYLKQFGKNN